MKNTDNILYILKNYHAQWEREYIRWIDTRTVELHTNMFTLLSLSDGITDDSYISTCFFSKLSIVNMYFLNKEKYNACF